MRWHGGRTTKDRAKTITKIRGARDQEVSSLDLEHTVTSSLDRVAHAGATRHNSSSEVQFVNIVFRFSLSVS
jgi:hypothetical protein